MPSCIPLRKALILAVGSTDQPVITKYQLGILVFRLYNSGAFQAQPLCRRREYIELTDFTRALRHLLDSGVLVENRNFGSRQVFNVLGREPGPVPAVACTVDPFAYVSHMSAMDFHGLTDRLPKILYLTSPPAPSWGLAAHERMKRDLGPLDSEYDDAGFPKLRRIRMRKIGRMPLHIHESLHLGAYKTLKDIHVRVATIGRTFLDMVRAPDLCGGIRHVIDVYREHAKTYLRLIVAEVEQHGAPIDKVRIGYILDEECNLHDPAVMSWSQFAQRGGSRKLIPSAEYSANYSDRWCLSINIEEA